MNIITAPINLLKTFSLQGPAGQSTSDGYPNGTLGSTVQSQGIAPDSYYDKSVMGWDGQARWDSAGTSAIIYANTGVTVPGISNSCVNNNLAFTSANAVGNRIVFKHGSLITGISGGNGSPVVLALINTPADMSVGQKVKVQVGVSSNLLNGPNSDGSWTLSAAGTSSATLANSSGVTSPTVTGAGGPDVQSEMVFSKPGIAWSFVSGNTYANFANAYFCKLVNETATKAGKQVDPDYVAQLKALGVRWLRTMDITGVQGNWETNWTARRQTSFITWAAAIRNPNYYVGAITNNGVASGGDDYTCSAPAITNAGPYQNGEVVQGIFSATNAAGLPTLNVNGRGKKSILALGAAYDFFVDIPVAAASAGQSMQYTFTASWFNSGTPYVFTYLTTTTGPFGSDLTSASILRANIHAAFNVDVTLNGFFTGRNSGLLTIYSLTQQQGAVTVSYSGPVTSSILTVPIGNYSSSGTTTLIYNYIHDAWMPRPGGLVQSAPHEYIVELANAIGADVWHNYSLMCSGAFVTSLVGFYRDNLSPGLRFKGEVGNELWNFGQEPWGYAITLGYALGMGNAQHQDNPASYSYCAARARQFGALAIASWTTTRPRKDLYIGVMSATFDIANTDQYFLGCQYLGSATYLAYGGLDGTAGSTNAASNYSASPNRLGDNFDAFGFAPYWGSDFLSGDCGGSGNVTNTLNGTVSQNAPLFVAANKWRDGNFSGAYDDLYNQFYANVSLGGPAGGLNLLRNYKNGNNQQAETVMRKWDPARIAALGKPIAVLHYEGGPQFGLGNINNGTNSPTIDIALLSNRLASQIVNSSWDISTYTALSAIAISSGTYDTSTGLITLTLASPATIPVAGPILGLTGTGALLGDLNGGWNVNAATSSSTTLVLKGSAGKGAITITGGTFYYNAMDLATQLCGLVYNFKFSTQFYQLYYNYMRDVTTVSSGRESAGSQYGYFQGQWGILPGNWSLGLGTAYSSAQAITDFNAGL